MKIIFKIIEYLPRTNQIVVKFSRQNSAKSIDCQGKCAMSTESFDFTDNVSLVESICAMGLGRIRRQDKKDEILTDNMMNDIIEGDDVDISKLVGNVYGTDEKYVKHPNSVRLKKIKV
tara:strand:- start:323 stop:676 length:354 start_codon:yes stop_codon:yes gene_type:complete